MRGARLSSSVLFVCLFAFLPFEAFGQIRPKAISVKGDASSPFIATSTIGNRYQFQLEYLRIDRRTDTLYFELHLPKGIVVDSYDPALQLQFGRGGRWLLEAENFDYWMPTSLRPKRYAKDGYPPRPRVLRLDLNWLDSQALQIDNLEVVATVHQPGGGLGYRDISFVFSKSFVLERSSHSDASK